MFVCILMFNSQMLLLSRSLSVAEHSKGKGNGCHYIDGYLQSFKALETEVSHFSQKQRYSITIDGDKEYNNVQLYWERMIGRRRREFR